MKKKWFRAKKYGWGWSPATWQAWGILVIFIILLTANAFRFEFKTAPINNGFFEFLFETLILVFLLNVICYLTGEKPSWHWGKKSK